MTPHPPLRGPPSPAGEGYCNVHSPEEIIVCVFRLSRDVGAPSPTKMRSHARGNYRLRVVFVTDSRGRLSLQKCVRTPEKIIVCVYCSSRDVEAPSPTKTGVSPEKIIVCV